MDDKVIDVSEIKPEYQSLREMIDDEVYTIPDYQRGYSWESQHRKDLFNDIKTMIRKRNSSHFMATIVCKKNKEEKGLTYFEVIDGQQRLTSLVIILKVLELEVNGDHDVKGFLKKTNGARLLDIGHSETDSNQTFSKFLDSGDVIEKTGSISEKNLKDAIKESVEFVKKLIEQNQISNSDILDSILNGLHFVRHTVSNDQTVYTVFEVLNSRGLSVRWLDKCKSLLIGTASEKEYNSMVIDDVKKDFSEIYKKLNIVSIDTDEIVRFASTFFDLNQTAKTLSTEDGYNCFKNILSDSKASAETIREISTLLKRVTVILVDLGNNPMRQAVTRIAHARFLYIALILKYKENTKLLQQWENVTFRIFGLAQKDSRTMVGDYVKLAQRIYSGKCNGKVFGQDDAALGLLEIGASDAYNPESVVDGIANRDLYKETNWRTELRYFFYKYELSLRKLSDAKTWTNQNNNDLQNVIWGSNDAEKTIEHIYPQNPEHQTKQIPAGKDWKGAFPYLGEKKRYIYTHRLGNLLLLNSELNNKARNHSYSKKCEDVYKKVQLEMVYKLLENKKWGKNEIERREKDLLDWAKKEWADVDFGLQISDKLKEES